MVASLALFGWSARSHVRQTTAPSIAFGMAGQVGQHAQNSVVMALSLGFGSNSFPPSMGVQNAKEIQLKKGVVKSDHAPLTESGVHGLNGENAVSNVDQAAPRAVVQLKSSHNLVVCLWKDLSRRRKTAAMALAPLLARSLTGLRKVSAV